MPIKVAINHITSYKYDRLVALYPHVLRLRPAAHCRIPIEAYTLRIRPENHFINWQQDPYGNFLARVVFPEKTDELYVEVEVIADMVVINPFDFFVEEYAEKYPFKYDDELTKELAPYLESKEDGPLLKAWVDALDKSEKTINDFLVYINSEVYKYVNYTLRMEPGVQTCEFTLEKALGSCRDSGWLLVQILRKLGLAARFVSGYLVQLSADVKPLEGPSGPEKDFTDLHAWAEVYVPGAGWIGLDPTSGLFAGEGHIPLACTPDPGSASPISGASDKCETEFFFSNTVTRIHEDPRVTKPYSNEQWDAINVLGKKVDEELKTGDVRLTMGGEPTFVSIDDMESAQWNTVADGVEKRKLSGELIRRLRQRFGPGGLLQVGTGKWYPGEPLPRWQLTLFWRKDGKPIWTKDHLIADDSKDYGFNSTHALKFMTTLTKYLGLDQDYVVPAYEDVFYFLWEENKLPVNLNPLKPDLKDPLERQKLAQVLKTGLNKPAGFALPLKYDFDSKRWLSSRWRFRREAMYLVPGNSPLGLRLPLNSIQQPKEEDYAKNFPRDLFAEVGPLEEYSTSVAKRYSEPLQVEVLPKEVKDKLAGHAVQEEEMIRTTLCIEPREGKLFVFLPPVDYMEHFLDLIASIEATADELEIPIVIEGYAGPRDNRITQMVVSPDPGVIEVNIHPSETWDQLLNNYSILYDEATQSRLGTEKFMLDGRHTGTGGGNHITVGGAKPEDSPLLRRPDVLRSLITYWQHHPGLSYLFASEFVGPTSQAPRVDEGRNETLYELEIAFEQIPEGENAPYWLVDRLFRHLLVDITGNTHRAELCIDKMFSPDSSSGRLGILEFRAFDMPPHFRMSMVQMLLIRTLIAWFWVKPYKHKLVRWGTELHDRFMLSHYVESDIKQITEDLKRAGYDFDFSWFAPFFEFRFPVCGKLEVGDIHLELRKGIEPWHVLGEEMTSGGTSRYVDSSLEKIQVKISGLTDSRYFLSCNGSRIPLKNTGTHGEYVAGIRYRAWQPPSALHPTIGVDSPLVFDIIDSWNGRSIGGCTYFVSHPGGRSYDNFPVNSYEAESRRVSRFWDNGHTPAAPKSVQDNLVTMGRFYYNGRPEGQMETPPEVFNPEYPYTLDLRKIKNKKN